MDRIDIATGGNSAKLYAAWLFVGIPLALGVLDTLTNAVKLFQ